MRRYIRINNKDNVMVALTELEIGQAVHADDNEIIIRQTIKRGHKFATQKIQKGDKIIKYGQPIGYAITNIELGEWIHTHNLKTNLSGILEYEYSPIVFGSEPISHMQYFKGFRRHNGDVGIRNELWVVPTVGCVNGLGSIMLEELKKNYDLSSIDAVEVFKHNYGCSQLGEDHGNTTRILSDIVKHPNAGGVLILGLGCENNQVDQMLELLKDFPMDRVRTLVVQDVENEIESGIIFLKELVDLMKHDIREELPVSELKVGLKCGGSDGLSGITANPLVGEFSDRLIRYGGSTVLTEVPEMFGAEQLLMNRCKDIGVFNKTVELINDFKDYFIAYDQPIYENPSPGNKKGGITTLEDKSLGCTQKSGSAPVVDVLKYGEIINQKGLNLLSAPGNDLVASTALGAAGCHMVLFTTGRGTPFGSFVPTVKISSNSELYNKKPHWIDYNAGVLVEDRSMDDTVEEFFQYIIDIASGLNVNNEIQGIREIAIFKTGVTL